MDKTKIKPYANLRDADLRGANLQDADLRDANLRDADLWGADLRGANLQGADLRGADLRGANLQGADLWGARLRGADLPPYLIVPEVGGFYAWKKTTEGVCKIYIPEEAKRVNAIGSRKCRASYVKVISGPGGKNPTRGPITAYKVGEIVHADKWDGDIRVECTHGIHFFMTKKEAEQW